MLDSSENDNFFNRFVISIDSTWKGYFDFLMLFVSCENTIIQAYYAAFGLPTTTTANIIDLSIEGLFLLDFFFCFCQQYKDEETQSIVTDIKAIAIHYFKGSCIFDLIAIIPFDMFVPSETPRLFRVLKLLRVPRLFALLNVERIKAQVSSYFNKRLQKAVEEGDETASYPILKSLLIVQFYKVIRLALVILIISYFIGIVWYILVCDFLPLRSEENGDDYDSFGAAYLNSCTLPDEGFKAKMLIKMWYYALTTLSTIGFGDMSPQSPEERMIGAFLMMFGVANFSFIMSQFIEILLNYKALGAVG